MVNLVEEISVLCSLAGCEPLFRFDLLMKGLGRPVEFRDKVSCRPRAKSLLLSLRLRAVLEATRADVR